MRKIHFSMLFLLGFFISSEIKAQNNDSVTIAAIYKEALTNNWSYKTLEKLCKEAPYRLAGSEASLKAVEIAFQKMLPIADTVYRQAVMAKHWVRGNKEIAEIISGHERRRIPALAIGGSVGTGKTGISGKLVEVKSFNELQQLGKKNVEGKIVFYNFPMNPLYMRPGKGYGEAGFQRTRGASEAARYGAIGTVVRSLSNIPEEYPHTGIMHYEDSVAKIPAITISTLEADNLSELLKKDPTTSFYYKTDCRTLPDVPSYNLIAEIRGSVHPEQVITVGGHIDSWDICEGAHDDGAGCVQSMEVLRLFKELKIKPKRTVRMVLFLDEETNQVGARKYASWVTERREKQYAAVESDAGGLMPAGMGCTTDSVRLTRFMELRKWFVPYKADQFIQGGGGVDIGFLRNTGEPMLSPNIDSQRYFEYHHSANDTFDKVSFRELQLGSAIMAGIIYLVDKRDTFE